MRGDGHPQWVDSPSSPPPDVVDGLEQDLCHPLPEMYAMSEGKECPPTARMVFLVTAEVVPMSLENDHCEEEEVLGEGASEGEPFDSMTDNEEEDADATMDVPVPRPGITRGAFESLDQVDLRSLFTQRASLMKNVPRCLVGPFRNALRVQVAVMPRGRSGTSSNQGTEFRSSGRVIFSPPSIGGSRGSTRHRGHFEETLQHVKAT